MPPVIQEAFERAELRARVESMADAWLARAVVARPQDRREALVIELAREEAARRGLRPMVPTVGPLALLPGGQGEALNAPGAAASIYAMSASPTLVDLDRRAAVARAEVERHLREHRIDHAEGERMLRRVVAVSPTWFADHRDDAEQLDRGLKLLEATEKALRDVARAEAMGAAMGAVVPWSALKALDRLRFRGSLTKGAYEKAIEPLGHGRAYVMRPLVEMFGVEAFYRITDTGQALVKGLNRLSATSESEAVARATREGLKVEEIAILRAVAAKPLSAAVFEREVGHRSGLLQHRFVEREASRQDVRLSAEGARRLAEASGPLLDDATRADLVRRSAAVVDALSSLSPALMARGVEATNALPHGPWLRDGLAFAYEAPELAAMVSRAEALTEALVAEDARLAAEAAELARARAEAARERAATRRAEKAARPHHVMVTRDNRFLSVVADRREDIAWAMQAAAAVAPVVAAESHADPVTIGGGRSMQRVAFASADAARAAFAAALATLESLKARGENISIGSEQLDPTVATVPLPPPREPRAPRAPSRDRLPAFHVFEVSVADDVIGSMSPAGRRKVASLDTRSATAEYDDGLPHGTRVRQSGGRTVFGPMMGPTAEVVIDTFREYLRDPPLEVADVTDQWTVVSDPPNPLPEGMDVFSSAVDGVGFVVGFPQGYPQGYPEPFWAAGSVILMPDGSQFIMRDPKGLTVNDRVGGVVERRTEFDIPLHKLAALEDAVAGLARKAAKIGQPPPTLVRVGEPFVKVVQVDREVEAPNGGTMLVRGDMPFRVQKVRIEGVTPRIEGWEFIGTLEPMPSGENLVKVVGAKVPERFRFSGTDCDHCRINRARGKVYVLREAATGKFQQVGRSCLADFLGSKSPEALASLAEQILQLLDQAGEDEDSFGGGGGGERGYMTRTFLEHAAWLIARNGFTSRKKSEDTGGMSTSDQVAMLLSGKPNSRKAVGLKDDDVMPPSAVETATNALAWAQSLPANVADDYLNNLRILSKEEAVFGRHIGLLASLVPAYQRAHGEEQKRKAEEQDAGKPTAHVGAVGGTWAGAVEVVYTKTFDGEYGKSELVVGRTGSGDKITWFSRGYEPPQAGNIVAVTNAKVKEHKYRVDNRTGVQQPETVLSHVKETHWPLFRGREPWRFTREEWDVVPEVVARRDLAAADAIPVIGQYDREARERWREATGAPPPNGAGYDPEWDAHVRRSNEPREAAVAAAIAKMRASGIADVHGLPDIPDHGNVVKSAYELGLPVPAEVLADFPAEVAFVDAQRAAAAAREARKRAKGKPSTPEEKALDSGVGTAVRLVVEAFGAMRSRIEGGRAYGDPVVGMHTATKAEVAAGNLITSPMVTYSHTSEGSRYMNWAVRLVFTPCGVVRISGRQSSYGSMTFDHHHGTRTLPYDQPGFVDHCVTMLTGKALVIPGPMDVATEAVTREAVRDLLARISKGAALVHWEGEPGYDAERRRAYIERIVKLLAMQPDTYRREVADAIRAEPGYTATFPPPERYEKKGDRDMLVASVVGAADSYREIMADEGAAADVADALGAKSRFWQDIAKHVGMNEWRGLRGAGFIIYNTAELLTRHRAPFDSIAYLAGTAGPASVIPAALEESVEWFAEVVAPMPEKVRNGLVGKLGAERMNSSAEAFMPDVYKVTERAVAAYEKAKEKKGAKK